MQTQTADGRGRPHAYQAVQRVFVAGADTQRQRLDAYADEYADVALKGTQQAICCPAGAQLHLPDGGIIPVAPFDWVVELPDGTMGSLTAEAVADHMEFVSGSDEQRDLYEQTVQQVANSRRKPKPNVDIRVEDAPRLAHPDSGEAAQAEFDARARATLVADLQRQADEARAQLQKVVGAARKRDIISADEGADWLEDGIAPDGVHVTYDGALGSYEVTRAPAATTASAGGAEDITEGTPDAEPGATKTGVPSEPSGT